MKRINSQKGQALVLIALAAVGIFAFAALAIDGSRAYSDKRHAQNTADTAALAAALASIKNTGTSAEKFAAAQLAATNRAADNGYDNDGTPSDFVPDTSAVIVERCDDTSITGRDCVGLPSGAVESEYIRVYIVSHLPSTFARVIGRKSITSAAEAIARVAGSSSSTSGPRYGTSAMVATRSDNQQHCLLLNGGADLGIHGSAFHVNCTHGNAVQVNSNINLQMDGRGKIVGCFNNNAAPQPMDCNQTPLVLNEAYFNTVPTTVAPPSCSGNGNATGPGVFPSGNSFIVNSGTATFTPGNIGSITLNSGAKAVFNPGVYCISGSFNMNGSNTLQGSGGTVKFVLQNAINFSSGTATFSDLEIYGNSFNLDIKNGSAWIADRFRLYNTGGGAFSVQAGGEFTSYDAYIFLKSGDIKWNSQSKIHLEAPRAPDTFAGLVLHKPWSNTSSTELNGGSTVYVKGTFMLPHSDVTFNGGNNFELHSQIIGYTFKVNGGGTVDIYYDASDNWGAPAGGDPTIELTK